MKMEAAAWAGASRAKAVMGVGARAEAGPGAAVVGLVAGVRPKPPTEAELAAGAWVGATVAEVNRAKAPAEAEAGVEGEEGEEEAQAVCSSRKRPRL